MTEARPPTQRLTSTQRRDVAQRIAPLVRSLSGWQSAIAGLRGRLDRHTLRGTGADGIAEEARRLGEEIRAAMAEFGDLDQMPDPVGRLYDMQHACSRAVEELNRIAGEAYRAGEAGAPVPSSRRMTIDAQRRSELSRNASRHRWQQAQAIPTQVQAIPIDD